MSITFYFLSIIFGFADCLLPSFKNQLSIQKDAPIRQLSILLDTFVYFLSFVLNKYATFATSKTN